MVNISTIMYTQIAQANGYINYKHGRDTFRTIRKSIRNMNREKVQLRLINKPGCIVAKGFISRKGKYIEF